MKVQREKWQEVNIWFRSCSFAFIRRSTTETHDCKGQFKFRKSPGRGRERESGKIQLQCFVCWRIAVFGSRATTAASKQTAAPRGDKSPELHVLHITTCSALVTASSTSFPSRYFSPLSGYRPVKTVVSYYCYNALMRLKSGSCKKGNIQLQEFNKALLVYSLLCHCLSYYLLYNCNPYDSSCSQFQHNENSTLTITAAWN